MADNDLRPGRGWSVGASPTEEDVALAVKDLGLDVRLLKTLLVDSTGAALPGGGASDPSFAVARHFNIAGTDLTRPANTTTYTALDSISNHATPASVSANAIDLSDLNDAPIDLTEILLEATDTGPGTAAARIRMHLFRSNPTSNSGVAGGDNLAWSNKKAGWFGSFLGTMRLFADGSAGILVPEEGSFRIANPATGAKTFWWQLQAVDGFVPSANSTIFTPRFKGLQGRL